MATDKKLFMVRYPHLTAWLKAQPGYSIFAPIQKQMEYINLARERVKLPPIEPKIVDDVIIQSLLAELEYKAVRMSGRIYPFDYNKKIRPYKV